MPLQNSMWYGNLSNPNFYRVSLLYVIHFVLHIVSRAISSVWSLKIYHNDDAEFGLCRCFPVMSWLSICLFSYSLPLVMPSIYDRWCGVLFVAGCSKNNLGFFLHCGVTVYSCIEMNLLGYTESILTHRWFLTMKISLNELLNFWCFNITPSNSLCTLYNV